jgi:hypothetical protein
LHSWPPRRRSPSAFNDTDVFDNRSLPGHKDSPADDAARTSGGGIIHFAVATPRGVRENFCARAGRRPHTCRRWLIRTCPPPTPIPDEKIAAFIRRWSQAESSERANYALFLTGLCDVLKLPHPEPASRDYEVNAYVFERLRDSTNRAQAMHELAFGAWNGELRCI